MAGEAGSLTSAPSVWGCALYVGDAKGRLFAFNSSNGDLLGFFAPQESAKVHATPAISPSLSRVIHAAGLHVYGLTPGLTLVWTVTMGAGPAGEVWNSPVIDDDANAVWIASDKLYRIRATDGAVVDSLVLRTCPSCPSVGAVWGSPTLAGKNSVVLGTSGLTTNAIFSVDRTDMTINWSVTTEGSVAAAVAYDDVNGLLVWGRTTPMLPATFTV